MIKYGFLEGYNLNNIPKFNNENERDDYFDNKVLITDDAYYPPYFTNVIKVDIDTVPQTSPINFVILVHNSKYYYYYVDKIRYINEEIYEIVLVQDTILTYMFNYTITEGNILRKCINRWNGTSINRNYIRENLSKGEFLVNTNENLLVERQPYDISYKWLLVVCDSSNQLATSMSALNMTYIVNKDLHNTNLVFLLFPLISYISEYEEYIDEYPTITCMMKNDLDNTYTTDTIIFDDIFSLLSDTSVYYARVIDNKLLGVDVLYDEIVQETGQPVKFIRHISQDNTDEILFGYRVNNLTFSVKRYIADYSKVDKWYNTGFTKNTSVGVTFNSSYIPQLLDNNYIDIRYGTPYTYVSPPLYKQNSVNIIFTCCYDIVNDEIALYNDKDDDYGCRQIINRHSNLNLTTDLWKQYANLYSSTISKGMAWENTKIDYRTAASLVNDSIFTSAGIITSLYGSPQGANVAISGITRGITDTTEAPLKHRDIEVKYEVNKENLQNAPDTLRESDNFLTNAISNSIKLRFLEYKVSDYEQVARQLEYKGYKVNEEYIGNDYICNIANIRYYYNFISMSVSNFKFNCMIPNNIIEDINQRLYNGVRFFNMRNIGNNTITSILQYDNIEIDNIEE